MAYNCPHCQEAIPDAVSKGEMLKKIAKHNTAADALEKQIDALQKEVRTSERKHKAALQTLREELTSGREREVALARMGFDDEGTAVAELLHSRLPEENRPPLTDWLQGMKDDPSTAHNLLKPYFGESNGNSSTPAAEETTPSTPSTPPATLPGSNGTPPPSSPPQWTPEAIRGLSNEEFLSNVGQLSNVLGTDLAALFGLQVQGMNHVRE
jgi:hypothetical protein